MSQAAELAARLGQVDVAQGLKIIEELSSTALEFDVIDDAMCLMHADGSVNIVENMGKGVVSVEAISSGNILKVLKHYRPFKDVFKNLIQ
jgi:hypothetical protein